MMNDKTAAQDLEIWSRAAVFYFPGFDPYLHWKPACCGTFLLFVLSLTSACSVKTGQAGTFFDKCTRKNDS